MPASPSSLPPSIDATQFHSEFGYLAPSMRFRRKIALTLKGATLGALAGAVAMFFMVTDRGEERAFTMLSAPAATMPAPPTMVAHPVPAPSAPAPSPRSASVPAATVATTPAPVVAMPMSSKPGAPANEPRPRVASAPAALTPAQLAAVNAAQVRFVPESLAVPVASGARGVAPVDAAPVDLIAQMSLIAVPPAAYAKAAAKPKKKILRDAPPERTVRQPPSQPEPRSAFAAEAPVPRILRSIFGL